MEVVALCNKLNEKRLYFEIEMMVARSIKSMSKADLEQEVASLRRQVAEFKKDQILFTRMENDQANFFQHVLENIPSDLVVFDIDHRYLYINPVAVKDQEMRAWLTGKTDYDYCKRTGKDVSLADYRRAEFNKVKESLQGVFYQEMMKNDQGEEIWNLRRMFPVIKSTGELHYIVGYATDITPLKIIEKDLQKAKAKAKVSMRIKEQFLANMSHEIRTPMNAILGMSNLLKDLKLNQKNRSYLDGISKSARNLIVVINDILDFSKISADKLDVEKIPINLIEEFGELKTLFEVKSSEKNIDLIFEVDSKINGVYFEGDPIRLNQIFNNLLGNALKFTEKGTVSFSALVKEQLGDQMTLVFSVKDTGIGIDEEVHDIIFMPFSQADASTTRQYGGTGLGLSISKRLVRLMGGELELRSAKGKGADFYFELTFSTTKIKGEAKQDQLFLREKIPQDFKVLLVEDNPMNQLYATSILEGYTNNVTLANNGREAIELLKVDPLFDLVLMDIQMPVMGGEECTEFIRSELHLDFPIIALTANAFKKDQVQYIEKGMNGYLSKPFEEKELLKIMHTFLPKSSTDAVNF